MISERSEFRKPSVSLLLLIPLMLVLLCLLASPVSAQGSESLTIRVGVYDNPPKVIYDQSTGRAGGFIPEILEEIARSEGWQINYVYGDWTTCLNRLAAGEIDIMVDVAYSEDRAALYDFNYETVFNNWGVIYRAPNADIENVTDLEGKTIGVMKGSIHTDGPNGIRALVASFNINCTFVEVDSYEDVFKLIDSGSADAGVVNRLYGETAEGQSKVKRTGIYFDPSEIRYAFPRNAALNPVLMTAIDNDLKAMKADKNSAYYAILDSYFGKPAAGIVIPGWVLPAVLSFIGAILFLFGMSVLFKWQVNRRTKELRSALDRSEELEEVINRSPSVVILWRNEAGWPIEVVSDNITLFGYTAEEFISGDLKYAEIIHPDDLERVAAEVERYPKDGNDEYTQSYRIRTKSGEARWVEDHTSIRRDEDDRITHYQGIVTDITKRRLAEEELQETEHQLFLTFKNVVDVLFNLSVDPGGRFRFVQVNNAFLAVTGLDESQVVGKYVEEVIPEPSLSLVLSKYQQAIEDNRTVRWEEVTPYPAGLKYGEVSATPIVDISGRCTNLLGVVHDITEPRQTQDRLEKLTRCFLELGPEPFENIEQIISCSWEILGGDFVAYSRLGDGRLSVLSTLRGMEGFRISVEPKTSVGYEIISGGGDEPFALDVSGTSYRESDPLVQKYGIASFLGYPVKAERVTGCLGLYDTNSRAFTPEEVHLMGMLARAITIEEERLAREENLKGFIDIAAHELRHPIAVLKGYAELLRDAGDKMEDDTKQHCLDAIDQGAKRLNKLTTELLDSSRIERGQFRIEKQEIALEPLIELVVETVREKGDGHKFRDSISEDIGTIQADPEKLQVLLAILLDNAVINSPSGSDIDITAELIDGNVAISILDRGPGIPEEHRERIFERFYQVEDADHHSTPGIGLGLYIAREIAEGHGGQIRYDLRSGGGSVFTLTIPA